MLFLSAHAETGPAPSRVNADIDWSEFLARHDLVWEVLSGQFDHGAFAGNGLLGTTLYQQGLSSLGHLLRCSTKSLAFLNDG